MKSFLKLFIIIIIMNESHLQCLICSSSQFESEEVPLGVSADGKSKQVWCDEGDYMENYFSVEIRNGNLPPPAFTFKLLQEPIGKRTCNVT